MTDQVVHASPNQAPSWIISPVANPRAAKDSTPELSAASERHSLPLSVLQVINASKHMSTWHQTPLSNHKVQAARCFPPQLSTSSLSHVPANRSYPPAGNHTNCQLPVQETGKTWGHNHTGRPYHAFMASWTIQPSPQVFNFLAVPSTSRGKPKPNSSSLPISCVV